MAIPIEEEFSLWKDLKVRSTFIQLIIGIIAFILVAIPASTWSSHKDFKWVGEYLYTTLVLLGIVNFILFSIFISAKDNALRDPRPWRIRYQPEKERLNQRLIIITDMDRNGFTRWISEEKRIWIYSTILGILALLFFILMMGNLSAAPDSEGSVFINFTGALIKLISLGVIGLWSGCYLLLITLRRVKWCNLLNIRGSHLKYLLAYPLDEYIQMGLRKKY